MITNATKLPKRIHQLSVHLANQIAAGEVVERPASVLKEILENSLDAESTQIDITLERGGIGLIRVQDNGIGICKEDLELALSAHATSKIKTLSDLEEVISYGFRGEALASISAVSRLELSSCVSEQETGFCVRREGRDSQPTIFPVPKRQGTCVEVKDLFYNTPARRKFLKSEKTEMSYLEEVFKRVALSQPLVAFKFQAGERVEKRLPVCKSIEMQTRRVAALCGKSFIENSYYMEVESNGLKLYGWLGSTAALRAQADLQYFYVNGRIVRDKVVSHAIRQAYQKICLPGRYPAYILYFELDPSSVDVNVHPTKHEVRFREARTVHAFLSYAIEEGLDFESKKTLKVVEETEDAVVKITDRGSDANKISLHQNLEPHYQQKTFWGKGAEDKQNQSLLSDISIHPQSQLEFQEQTRHSAAFKVPDKKLLTPEPKLSNLSVSKPLAILGGELLLAEDNDALLVIEVKKLQKEFVKRKTQEEYHQGGVAKRPLLIPKTLIVGEIASRADAAESGSVDWERLGFEWSPVGETSILVRAVPELFGAAIEQLNELLQKLLILTEVEACIHLMVHHSVETQKLSFEQAKAIVDNFKKEKQFADGDVLMNYSKRVSLGQLKLFLLSN
jgi:DNA mismatch repair protein MutL